MTKFFLFLSSERFNRATNLALEECLNLSDDVSCSLKSLNSLSINSIKLKSVEGDSSNEWQDVEIECCNHEWTAIKNQDSFEGAESQNEKEFRFNDFFKLSEFLHKYADNKCELGKDILQIFWCVQSYAPCPSEVVEFFGALKRLHTWHNASIAIVTKDSSIVQEWDGLFPIQVVDSCLPIVKDALSICWRGSLSVSFEGKGEEFFPNILISAELSEKTSHFEDILDSSYVLPVAEVFNEIDISTIPWVCIKNVHSITIPPDIVGEQRDCICEILRLASQTTGIGTLIRIRHSPNPPTLTNFKSLTTETWKQNITDGQFNLRPIFTFEANHQCSVLMILNEGRMNDKVFVVSLQGTNECGEEITKMILDESLKNRPDTSFFEKEKIYGLIQKTKLISNVEVAALSHLLRNLPKKIKKMISKKADVDKLSPDMKASWEKICNEEISRFILTKSSKDSYLEIVPSPDASVISPEISQAMEEWPEYLALAELDNGNKSALKRSSSSDLLLGLQPPVRHPPKGSSSFLDNAQMLSVFEKSGRATKDVLNKMTTYDKRGVSYFKGWGKRANDVPWQKALHSNIHGVCYNSTDEKERFELSSNRTRDRHIINETASTCSSFKNREIRLSRKRSGFQNRLAPLSDMDSDTISEATSTRTGSIAAFSDNKGPSSIMTETKSSKRLSLNPSRKDLNSILKETQKKRQSLEMLDSNADLHAFNVNNGGESALRRSPRKHMSKGMKPSDLLGSRPALLSKYDNRHSYQQLNQKRNPKPADLSDLHKSKLRYAIKTALDSESISMKDQLFKQCFQKLFAVCRPFALDVIGLGSTTKNMEKIALSHVKQVIEFERLKRRKR